MKHMSPNKSRSWPRSAVQQKKSSIGYLDVQVGTPSMNVTNNLPEFRFSIAQA